MCAPEGQSCLEKLISSFLISTLLLLSLASCSSVRYLPIPGGVDLSNLQIGMTQDELLEIEHSPNEILKSTSNTIVKGKIVSTVYERWIYYDSLYSAQHLYWENGILVSWEEVED